MRSSAKFTLFILLLTVMLTACSSEKKTAEDSPAPTPKEEVVKNTSTDDTKEKEVHNKTQQFSGENFSFSYPSTWKDAELNIPQISAAFVNPNSQGPFAENVNLVIEESSATPKEAADISAQSLASGAGGEIIQNYKKLNYMDIADKAAGILEAEYTQGELNAQVISTQYFVSDGQAMYILSISYSKEAYDNGGKSIVQNIIDSFEIVNANHAVADPNANAGTNNDDLTEENLFAEMMAYIIPIDVENGTLDQKTYNYIVKNYTLFPAVTPETQKKAIAEVNPNIDSRHLFKNINPYLEQMIEVSGYVVEIMEEEIDEGLTVTEIHIIDDYDNSIFGYYAHTTGDILQDDYVTMRGVPATYYSFENISGGTTNSVLMGISTIEKTP